MNHGFKRMTSVVLFGNKKKLVTCVLSKQVKLQSFEKLLSVGLNQIELIYLKLVFLYLF
jgi:hypothetical protein